MIRKFFEPRFNIYLSKFLIGIIIPTFLLTGNSLLPTYIQVQDLDMQDGKRLEINDVDFHESKEVDSETNSIVNSPVQVLSDGSRYFLKADMHDQRVRLRVGLANNDSGGFETLASIKNRYSNQGFSEWAIINGDYFSMNYDCPSSENCAEGLTYIDSERKINWSGYGTTWPVRSNFGIDTSKYMQMAIGDNPQKHMVIAGGPWIVKDGGTPTCQAEYISDLKITYFSTGEQFNGDVTDWCTQPGVLTMIGFSEDRKYVYMGMSSGGMNVVQLGQWLKDQGAYDVIKLDSGGSSGIYHNNVLKKGFNDRPIANHLALIVDDIPIQPPPPSGSWNVTYYNGTNFDQQCGSEMIYDTFVFKDWGNDKPSSGCNSDNWSARFTRRINFDAGSYNFGLFSDDWSKIKIGNDTVVNKWPPASQVYEGRQLDGGDYDVTIEFADTLGAAKIAAWWWGPGYIVRREEQDPNKWYAQYWGNKDLSWDSIVRVNEEFGPINHNWDLEGPGYGLPVDGFSSRIEREKVFFHCGSYRFTIMSDDGYRFYIDDKEYLSAWSDGIHSEDQSFDMDTGFHKIMIEQYENKGSAAIRLNWFGNSLCDGVELFDKEEYGEGAKIEWREEYSGAVPDNFDNLASSIWISPGWSVRVFNDKIITGKSEENCIEFSNFSLNDDYFNGGTIINNNISSIEVFNEDTCPQRGDVNRDGLINVIDILEVIAVYQTSPPANPKADLNFDNVVNVMDILTVVANYPTSRTNEKLLGNQFIEYLGSKSETIVSIKPENQAKKIGDNFEYSIMMDTNNNLVAGFDLEIEFDPSIYKINSIQKGNDVMSFSTEAMNEINNDDGLLLYGLSTSNLNEAIQGSNIELMKVLGNVKSDVQIGYCEHTFGIKTITANSDAENVLQETISGKIEIDISPNVCIKSINYLPITVGGSVKNVKNVTIFGEEEDGEALNNPCDDWETCRNSTQGTSVWQGLEVGTVGSIFTEYGYMIARPFLFFDTSSIPSNATITSATLNIYAGQWQNGNKKFHVVPSNASIPLSVEDFSMIEYISGGSVTPSAPFFWMEIPLNSSALNWIKPGDMTQFAIVHEYDFNNVTPTEPNDVLIAFAEDADHKPYLTITYEVP